MIQELRIYTVKVGQMAVYLQHFEQVGLPIARRYMFLAGFWTTEYGEINELFHLWDFPDLAQRSEIRARLHSAPDWQRDFLPKALEVIVAQRTVILKPTAFSPPFSSGLIANP